MSPFLKTAMDRAILIWMEALCVGGLGTRLTQLQSVASAAKITSQVGLSVAMCGHGVATPVESAGQWIYTRTPQETAGSNTKSTGTTMSTLCPATCESTCKGNFQNPFEQSIKQLHFGCHGPAG
mmetsp:Transcript_42852/g.128631  ORF Transcript_42852/g.128631 Transcript_42852/m.128631 type:complete len:124 (+) Transcript_42852:501-872(+)